ncbi:MAG TPA: hypothetical protein VMJ34_20705 [Bryobacteraceae bacterium]|nr:hypothetical protein [Bryobacteraceae bacterium]
MMRGIPMFTGVLIALAGIALLFFGASWLAPHLLDARSARVPIVAFLVICLAALQLSRWRNARKRRTQTKGDDVPKRPLGLDT